MNFSDTNSKTRLAGGRLLARNTIWNLIGGGVPMLVAIVCIPILIKGLGKDRFGILALAWVIIGYAGFFDLGVGRALTQFVAKKLGAGEDRDVPPLVWTSLFLMLLLGILGGVVVILISPWLVHHALHIPAALQRETLHSFYLLGVSLPIVITTAGLRGFLEAHQRFDLVNALRIPLNAFVFAGPLLVLPFSHSLFPVVAVLVGGRVIGWVAHLLLCLRVMPGLLRRIAWHRATVGPLLSFGGWLTVTNIVSPLMVALDRFLIGALLSVTAVAYYATPFEVVTRLLLIPGAVVGVMFPAFSASFVQDRNRTAFLYGRSVKYVLLALFPMILLILVFAESGLKLWLGADFAQHSTRVLQWLAVGVFINGLALIPYSLLQGVGRPDLTAKLHMAELPAYLLALWWLIHAYGIDGAAMAWTARVFVDALLLFGMAKRFLPSRATEERTLLQDI
ncbi:MAG: flippase [Candidatus Acidiferrales bacterium]